MSAHENGNEYSNAELAKDIVTPHDHDVLSGRGNFVNYHAGNERFRALVKKHKIAYVACPKPQKGKYSRMIVDEIRGMKPPGRFLKQDASTKLWQEIGDKKALDKTRQALREGAPELLKELAEDETEDGTGVPSSELYNVQDHHCGALRPHSNLDVGQSHHAHLGSAPHELRGLALAPDQIHPGKLAQPHVVPSSSDMPPPLNRRHNVIPNHSVPLSEHNGSLSRSPNQDESVSRLHGLTASHNVQQGSATRTTAVEGNAGQSQMLTVSYPADQFEPTPLNPYQANTAFRSGAQENVTIRLPAAKSRTIPVQGIDRADSLTFEDLERGSKSTAKSKSNMASSGNMSFSIGDLCNESNLSAVFEDSLRFTDASQDRAKEKTKQALKTQTPTLTKSSNGGSKTSESAKNTAASVDDMSFSLSQTVDLLGSSLQMSYSRFDEEG